MKHIKFEITAFVFLISVLISNKAGFNGPLLIIIDGICILALCVLGFLVISAVESEYEETNKTRMGAVSYEQIKGLIEALAHTTGEYTKRVDSLIEIQDKLNSEFHDYLLEAESSNRKNVEEARERNAEIERIIHEFSKDYLKLSRNVSEDNKKELEVFRTDIRQVLADYIKVSESLTDEMKAVKAIVSKNMDSFRTTMRAQVEEMLEKLEECEDSLDDGFENFIKEQKKCNENQTRELSDKVKSIEIVIAEQVCSIARANEELLKYIQKMQEEWTTLGRDEIEFLSKVWDET